MDLIKSFSEFFNNSFVKDKAYQDFAHINEMATRFHQLNSKPANIDEEDIEFLNQFPHDYWVKAKKARYDMLYQAVKNLHNKRQKEFNQGKIKKQIIDAMNSGNWNDLNEIVPEKNVNWLKHKSASLNKKEKETEAERLSHNYVKNLTPHIEDSNEEIPFVLKGSSDKTVGRKPVTFMAKPFLNRLYHKLETTHGHPFHKDSGLKGVGKYGFDMAEPLDADGKGNVKTDSTSGMKFPTENQIRNRMVDFFNLNSHRIFGNLPDNAEWNIVPGISDTWSVNYIKDQIQKRIESQLRLSGKVYEKESDLRKESVELAKEKIIEMAEKGELKGPPIPGKFPDGIPIKYEGGKLINPPLYLPTVMKDIKTRDEQGNITTVKKAVPIVNPAHYFRELGSQASDYVTDSEGKKQYDPNTGDPIYNVPQDQLRGHEGKFVHVHDDDFVKKKHRATGAIDFNSDTEQSMPITKGDPEWQDAWNKVFEDQKKVLISPSGKKVKTTGAGFYEDIIDGIQRCLRSGVCGGATHHELDMIRNNIEDFHQIVLMKMLNNLGDPKLETSKGRKDFAYTKISTLMQKDQGGGGGSRRRRNKIMRTTSFSAGGDEKDISDELMSKVTGKTTGDFKRKQGNRERDTSGTNTPYNLNNLRQSILQMRQDAVDADQSSEEARQLSQHQSGEEIIDMLRNGINKQIDFKMFLTDTLTSLYQAKGMSASDAKSTSESLVKSWINEDGYKTSEALLNAFQNHPLVKDAIQAASGEEMPVEKGAEESNEQEALKFLQSTLDRMMDAKLPEDEIKAKLLPQPGEQHSKFVQELISQGISERRFTDSPNLGDVIQKEINRRYSDPLKNIVDRRKQGVNPATTATTQVAKVISPAGGGLRSRIDKLKMNNEPHPASTTPIRELLDNKEWMKLSHNNQFLNSQMPNMIAMKRKMLSNLQAVDPSKYPAHHVASAIANLKRSLGE